MKKEIFCLLTDFGYKDMYVGQMKCVIYQKISQAKIIDISHDILPHNILQGSFFLLSSWNYLPENSITIAVVDPGVGSSRDILILMSGQKIVIAPDNGILYPLIKKYNLDPIIYVLNWERFVHVVKQRKISSTFHGRDVFAPLATYIALGNDIEKVSKKISIEDINTIHFPEIKIDGNKIDLKIIHIDRFGNCVTTIEEKFFDIFSKKKITIMPFNKTLRMVKTYNDLKKGEIGMLVGSQGYLEISLWKDSFAKKCNVQIGDKFYLVIE